MEQQGAMCRTGSRSGARFSSTERLAAIGLTVLAVLSPLIIDRRQEVWPEDEDELINFASGLPFLLLVLIVAIALSRYFDKSFTKFDANWIHRVGGSSVGIIITIIILLLVLKCKAA